MPVLTVLPIFTFLLGLLGGHRLALFRDRRKEYNEIADIIDQDLELKEVEITPTGPIDREHVRLLRRCLDDWTTWWPRWRFEAALRNYEAALANDNITGEEVTAMGGSNLSFVDSEKVRIAIRRLRRHVKRR